MSRSKRCPINFKYPLNPGAGIGPYTPIPIIHATTKTSDAIPSSEDSIFFSLRIAISTGVQIMIRLRIYFLCTVWLAALGSTALGQANWQAEWDKTLQAAESEGQ